MESLLNNWPTGSSPQDDCRRDQLNEQIREVNQMFRFIAQLRDMNSNLTFGRLQWQC